MNKILLLDGNSMLFRAYYGTLGRGLMMSDSGVVTNAVYGFSTMLNKALELIEPTHLLVAFDTKEKTFRHKMYDEYKGTRPDLDPELISQFELVREFLDAYPITRYELGGYEADDIIGTLSKRYPDAEIDILTSDQDMLQLIDDHVRVILMKKGLTNFKIMDREALMAEEEITPEQVVDMKALMGDSSDNIPGVPSIGPKTALRLIKKYGDFENVYAHEDEIKGKMGENLRKYKEQAKLSYDLAKIHCDVPIELTLDDFKLTKPDQSLNAFYRKYSMDTLVREDVEVEKDAKIKFEKVSFDALDLSKDINVYWAYNKKGQITQAYIAQGTQSALIEDLSDTSIWEKVFSAPQIIFSESKPAFHIALKLQVDVPKEFEDMMLLAFIVDSSVTTMERLKDRHDFWFHEFEGEDQYHVRAISLTNLYDKLKQEADKDDVYRTYEEIEKPLVSVLASCEFEGIDVDQTILDKIAADTKEKLDALSSEIFTYAGQEFNLNSPKQLSEILFDVLELPQIKKRSTAVGVLEKLEDKHPIIAPVLEYRKYQKLYSTYASGLTKYIADDGKIHTTFNQHATQTGRLSSSDPNLQNISVRDPETREIRRAFLASEGAYLVSLDYSQIELRVLAFLAKEAKMIEAFKNHEDIHERTAREIFHQEAVDGSMRRQAKSVNFGIVYGMSPYGLSKQLDIPMGQASDFIKRYHAAYPNIEVYMNTLIDQCKETGYVTTYFNRRRYIPEIHSSNHGTRSFGERAAMNAPIQGTAADIIKLAMVKVQNHLNDQGYRSKMLLQVHDELVFNMYEDEMEQLIPEIKIIMEEIVQWPVPLEVSVTVGRNWLEDIYA